MPLAGPFDGALRAVLLLVGLALAAGPAAAQPLKPWRGGPLPGFELAALDGTTHRLAAYRGRVVLVNFWASWCGPCRAEMPSLQALSDSFEGKPFLILAVNVGEPAAKVAAFQRQVPVRFPLLLDPAGATGRAWGARALPTTVVLDPDGRPRYAYVGDLDWNQPDVRDAIRALMPGAGRGLETARLAPGYSASSGTWNVVPRTTIPPRSPATTLP